MAKAIDDYAATTDEQVIVQTGYTKYDYKHAKAFDFCSPEEMQRYVDKAQILILQGGWGALSEAVKKHKRIVSIPRIEGSEHNHNQIQIVQKLERLGCVIGVYDVRDLPQAIQAAYLYNFKQINRGEAESRIRQKLNDWFG
ncbi:MAG: glycosyltransferase [Rikenellaceae bacterium]